MDIPRTDSTANTPDGNHTETAWTDVRQRSRVFVAGEVATSTLLQMPQPRRIAYWWNDMVRQAARVLVGNADSKLRWIPLATLIVGLVFSVGATIMAWGVWRGHAETKEETLSANQAAMSKLIDASEARLMRAAEELKQSAREMRNELNTKVDAIDNKAESIRGSVANQQAQLAELRARLEAANEDRGRLWQKLETYDLKLQRLERERLGIAPLPLPGAVSPPNH